MKEACEELRSSRKGVLREFREGLPDRGLRGERAGPAGCSQTPGKGLHRGEEGREEDALQGAHGVRQRGDPRTPRAAGRAKDVGLFSEGTGAIDKK